MKPFQTLTTIVVTCLLLPQASVIAIGRARPRIRSKAALTTNSCPDSLAACPLRTYFIQAEDTDWNYAPSGKDNFHGVDLKDSENAATFLVQGTGRIGPVHQKALYYEYTDETFTKRVDKAPWQGYLGPIIRAEIGDVIKIVFRNQLKKANNGEGFKASMHSHGVQYTMENDGALYSATANDTGAQVPPGGNYTYTWSVPARSGPGPADENALLWMYHSHVNEHMDINSGLMGPLIVYRKGYLNEAAQKGTDVDREFVALFLVNDENVSHYLADDIARFAGNTTQTDGAAGTIKLDDEEFQESNKKHAINGRMFANLDGLVMKAGEKVRWFVAGFGNEVDLHTAHWHGQTVLHEGHRTDVVELLPAPFKTASMIADTPSQWLLHCHVSDHMMGGMIAAFNVTSN